MNTKQISKTLFALALVLVATPSLTFAASADTTQAKLTKIIERSDKAIGLRIDALNKLATRVQGMKNVSDTDKSSLNANISASISGLNSLKAKIDADTDVTVAQSDEKQITAGYRIYALVIPQGYIEASVDRINTVTTLMTDLSAKLQVRIATSTDTSLAGTLADLNSKIADAKSQAAAAQSEVASLTPDQGDKTKLAANTAALKDARAKIKAATTDLQAARKDIRTIVQGLRKTK